MYYQPEITTLFRAAVENAAFFNLQVMRQLCDSSPDNELSTHIWNGLTVLGEQENTKALIKDLTGVEKLTGDNKNDLPMVPYQMAYAKPLENLALETLFTQALHASRQVALTHTAAFNLYVMQQLCDSDPDNGLACRIMIGLMTSGKGGSAKALISDITGVAQLAPESKQRLPMLPYEMAHTKSQETLILGEIFAEALEIETGLFAGKQSDLETDLPQIYKSTIASNVLAVHAPALASLFRPAPVLMQ